MAKRRKKKTKNPVMFPGGISYATLGNHPKLGRKNALVQRVVAAVLGTSAKTGVGIKAAVNRALKGTIKKRKISGKQKAALAKGRAKARRMGYGKKKRK